MDLYATLNLNPTRSTPDVWVRRLVIYERIGSDARVIRDIALKRGLNIVWAEEPENDDSDAEIAGHSAGKTTFCRLVRYVLGETTFGSKANMAMVRSALPDAYVAAELFVRGQQWAVLRPIGSGRSSYVKRDASVEDLLLDRSQSANQSEYATILGLDSLIDDLDTGSVVRTGEPIRWGHLLAWCTRDQEARFQNIYEWRSSRSESEWPTFRFPKADPLFVMRAVLGLFLPNELRGEEELAGLLRDQEHLEKQLEDLRREPQFRANRYQAELRQQLRAVFPTNDEIGTMPLRSDALAPDLTRLVDSALEQLRSSAATADDERTTLQDKIDSVGGQILRLESQAATLRTLFEVEQAGTREMAAGLTELRVERDLVSNRGDEMCPYGKVKLRDCVHVQERQQAIRPAIVQDSHLMEQAEAKRLEALKRNEADLNALATQIEAAKARRNELQSQRDERVAKARQYRDTVWQLQRTIALLTEWAQKQQAPAEFTELNECQRKLKDTADRVAVLKERLSTLLVQHSDNRKLLERIFSGAVNAVLTSGTYDGQVGLEDRELSFRITHGTAMSGEAVETLCVLLADVAGLVYHSVAERSRLPGFVVHDSPREADLGIRLYRGLIRLVGSLETHFGSADECPFQYILTTTTAPPEEMRGEVLVRLKLNAAVTEGLLFKRNVAMPQGGLFDQSPAQ